MAALVVVGFYRGGWYTGRPLLQPCMTGRLLWPDHHHHLAAFQLGKAFQLAGLFRDHFICDTVQQFQTKLLVRHFATPEAQGHFNLVAFAQEFQHRAHLDIIVMLVRAGTKLDFLDFNDVLLFAGLSLALLLLILEFAEVHDLADRRFRIGRDFNQVKPGLLGLGHRAGWRNNANVFPVCANQANLGAANAVVHAGARIALRRGVVGSAGYGLLPSFIDNGAGALPPRGIK